MLRDHAAQRREHKRHWSAHREETYSHFLTCSRMAIDKAETVLKFRGLLTEKADAFPDEATAKLAGYLLEGERSPDNMREIEKELLTAVSDAEKASACL